MAVSSITPLQTKHSAQGSSDGTRTFTETFRVVVDSVTDNESALRRGTLAYQAYQPHPDAAQEGFYVDPAGPTYERINNTAWQMEVTYTSAEVKNPLDEPAEISRATAEEQYFTLVDNKGRPLRNTANDWFNPLPKSEVIEIITIKKNLATLPKWRLDLSDAVNSDTVTIEGEAKEPRTLKIGSYRLDNKTTRNGVEYYPLTLELKYKRTTWRKKYPSMGLRQLVADITQEKSDADNFWNGNQQQPKQKTTKRLEPIIDKFGNPVRQPQFLDADGGAINSEDPDEVVDKMVIMEFDIQQELSMQGLPLT